MKRDYTEARRFIDEFHYATGRYAGPLDALPAEPSDWPNITFTRDHVIRFRNNYRLLAEFTAFLCNTTVEKLCPLDLMAYLGMLKSSEDDDGSNHGNR